MVAGTGCRAGQLVACDCRSCHPTSDVTLPSGDAPCAIVDSGAETSFVFSTILGYRWSTVSSIARCAESIIYRLSYLPFVPSTVPRTVSSTVPCTVSSTVPFTVPSTVPFTIPCTVPCTVSSTVSSTVPSNVCPIYHIVLFTICPISLHETA